MKTKELNDLESTHLINIIHHINSYELIPYTTKIIRVCETILYSRGIDLKILNFGQIPHRNMFGVWAKWDYEVNVLIELPSLSIHKDYGLEALEWSKWVDKDVIKNIEF